MRRTVLLSAAAVVMIVALVAAGYVAYDSVRSPSKVITAEVTAYTAKPPYRVTIQVDKPPADTVRCVVYAIDFDSQAVGMVDNIVVPPQKSRSTRLSIVVPTTKAPTQFQVEECLVQH